MDNALLKKISGEYGDAFYILDTRQFVNNFTELKKAFSDIYPHFNIAYSYKTNYTPALCGEINRLGGFAEVVSDMEAEIALRVGVRPENIIWNGPYKNYGKAEELLLAGGTVNLDSVYELELIKDIAKRHPSDILNLGIRVNFEINDGVVSRFGFDVESEDFKKALALIKETGNLKLKGLQCHFATRRLDTWKPRAEKMLALIEKLNVKPEHIDLGGGLFGKMADSLKSQFDCYIPSYADYANEVAPIFAEYFKNKDYKPTLFIEPGSALVGDCMKFVSKVVNIKTVRNKPIATVLGSIYNINPTLNKKNPPLEIYSSQESLQKEYKDLDFGGFTCIESDYLYRGFNGKLAVGDYAVFGNAGSYSVVLKPPFILPNFPVIEIEGECVRLIKRGEVFDDLFATYTFKR